MRTLIDGYNVMYAGGLLGRKFGPDGFRQVRHRFLNDLAASSGATEAYLTTVVFDAATAPPDRASTARHKGLTILYAVDSDDADTRIEELIAHHSSPKHLTVVSSDHRIQKAALRRRSKIMTADAFWVDLDARKARKRTAHALAKIESNSPSSMPIETDAADWVAEFGALADSEEARALFAPDPLFPTDADLARIAREVDAEFRR